MESLEGSESFSCRRVRGDAVMDSSLGEIFVRDRDSTLDIQQLVSMGIASGYMAVLGLGFYASSREVAILYASPEMLWLFVRRCFIGSTVLGCYAIGTIVALVMALAKYDLGLL